MEAFFACGFRKCLARNELSEDDSHGSEDNCAEVKRKQTMVETTMKSMMMMTSAMLNLIMLNIEGPKLQEFDFDRAFKFWYKRPRRMVLDT